MIILEAISENSSLRIGLGEQNEAVSPYETGPVPVKEIEFHCKKIFEILNNPGAKSPGDTETLRKLKNLGSTLSDKLLTISIKTELRQTEQNHLIVKCDEHLAHIPWELLCIEDEFLCQRFSMGRNVRTKQKIAKKVKRKTGPYLNMYVVADPEKNLPNAVQEGLEICNYIDRINQKQIIIKAVLDSVNNKNNEITKEKIKQEIRNYDFFHFAGHADYDPDNPGKSGWKFIDDILKADDIKEMAGGSAMPFLIFSNACQSSGTQQWKQNTNTKDNFLGTANAFILAGVNHYIGSSWEIRDESSSLFACEFYKNLVSGKTIGRAMQSARQAMIEHGSDIGWASYVLYGDPAYRYFNKSGESEEIIEINRPVSEKEPDIPGKNNDKQSIRSKPHAQVLTRGNYKKPPVLFLSAVLIMLIFSAMIFFKVFNTKVLDKWTSIPLQIAVVFDLEKSFDPELEEILSAVIEIKLMVFKRIRLVDRMTFAMTHKEMRINKSGWIDPDKKLKSGRGLPANLRLNIKIAKSGLDNTVQMRLIDNETGGYIQVFSKKFDSQSSIKEQKDYLAGELLNKLKRLYPLRGRVIDLSGKNISLNIGNDVGVEPGQIFTMPDNKDIKLEIISVSEDTCIAVLKKNKFVIEKGEKVKLYFK